MVYEGHQKWAFLVTNDLRRFKNVYKYSNVVQIMYLLEDFLCLLHFYFFQFFLIGHQRPRIRLIIALTRWSHKILLFWYPAWLIYLFISQQIGHFLTSYKVDNRLDRFTSVLYLDQIRYFLDLKLTKSGHYWPSETSYKVGSRLGTIC